MIEHPPKYSKRIPIFGDIHGNIEGLFNTVEHLQKIYAEQFRQVFQLGDFGYYPKDIPKKLKSDLEKGVHNYYTSEQFAKELMSKQDLIFKLFFIRGNHEDQAELNKKMQEQKNGTIITDPAKRIIFFPDGRSISIQVTPEIDCTIAVLGGINPCSRPGSYKRDKLVGFSEKGIDSLMDYRTMDVLLTHQGPYHTQKGDNEITAILELLQPTIHLHGHSHNSEEMAEIGKTKSYGLDKMPYSKRPYKINKNFYGILELEEMKFIPGAQLP